MQDAGQTPDASQTLAKLQAQRARAAARVAAVEQEARDAVAAAAAAREALVELERRGGARQADRAKLEERLAEAEARAQQPWPVRREGAERAVRDADRELREHVTAHLTELVAPIEVEAEAAVEDLLAACQAVVAAHTRREAAAQEVGRLAAMVGRVRPGDIGPASHAERAAAEASRVLLEGEPVPRLRHDPRVPRHSAVSEEQTAVTA